MSEMSDEENADMPGPSHRHRSGPSHKPSAGFSTNLPDSPESSTGGDEDTNAGDNKLAVKRQIRLLHAQAQRPAPISFVPVWDRPFPSLLSLEYYRVERTLWPAHVYEGGWKRVYACPIGGGSCPFQLVAFRSAGPKGYTVYERDLHDHDEHGRPAIKSELNDDEEPRKRREKTAEEQMVARFGKYGVSLQHRQLALFSSRAELAALIASLPTLRCDRKATYRGQKTAYRCRPTAWRSKCSYRLLVIDVGATGAEIHVFERGKHHHNLAASQPRVGVAPSSKAPPTLNRTTAGRILKKAKKSTPSAPAKSKSKSAITLELSGAELKRRYRLIHPDNRLSTVFHSPRALDEWRRERRLVIAQTKKADTQQYRCWQYAKTGCPYAAVTVEPPESQGSIYVFERGRHNHPMVESTSAADAAQEPLTRSISAPTTLPQPPKLRVKQEPADSYSPPPITATTTHPKWVRKLGIDDSYHCVGMADSPDALTTLMRRQRLIKRRESLGGARTKLCCTRYPKAPADTERCRYGGYALNEPGTAGRVHLYVRGAHNHA